MLWRRRVVWGFRVPTDYRAWGSVLTPGHGPRQDPHFGNLIRNLVHIWTHRTLLYEKCSILKLQFSSHPAGSMAWQGKICVLWSWNPSKGLGLKLSDFNQICTSELKARSGAHPQPWCDRLRQRSLWKQTRLDRLY